MAETIQERLRFHGRYGRETESEAGARRYRAAEDAADRLDALEGLLREALEVLEPLVCYASTRKEWPVNDIITRIDAALEGK